MKLVCSDCRFYTNKVRQITSRRILGGTFMCCVLLCITVSCSSSAHIVIRDNAAYSLTAEFVPSPLLEKNIAHLLKQNEQTTEQSVFNRRELQEALTQSGLTVTDISLKGTMGLALACTLPADHELLKNFITYDQKQRQVRLRISPDNIASFLEMLPQESRDFIDMLMAPLFTGDTLSLTEYEELIGAAYGKKIAAELHNASFILTVDVPYTIQSVQMSPIGTVTFKQSNRAIVHIPLLELLCTTGTIDVRLSH